MLETLVLFVVAAAAVFSFVLALAVGTWDSEDFE